MRVFDLHCDVLLKLWEDKQLAFTEDLPQLKASFPQLQRGKVGIQGFAIFVPDEVGYHGRFQAALEMIHIYYQQMIPAGFQLIKSAADLARISQQKLRGGLLFLEGAHVLEENIHYLHTFYQLGVRGIGLTWNYRNAVADGCLEPNPGGLSAFGRKVIREMNQLGMIIDIAHLAKPGFWDVMEHSSAPVIASHANARKLCDHPRNLEDDQILALIEKGGGIGLTFVPYFVKEQSSSVWIDDLLRHLDHICALGGVDHVGFGSDFDGISHTFADLDRAEKYPLLINELLKRYREEHVEQFVYKNWLRIFGNVI